MHQRVLDLVADTPRAAAGRRTLAWIAGGLAAAATLTGGLVAPADQLQGQAQRLMYLHVPAAWVAYAAFTVVLLGSGAYLINRDLRFDRLARSAAEIGIVLTAATIATGAVWGHLVWGTWWAWDPRLVSSALLLAVYAGYLALRRLLSERHAAADSADHRVARSVAAVGVAAFLLVPVVHFSVVWWRSLHQQATVLAPQRPPIDPRMGTALLLAVAAATAAALYVLLRRLAALERQSARAVRQATPARTPVRTG
ncbi:cytochrome c biogenesis protein CcsA [Micromonospora sp. NPDC049460]|uniref:cytochrome c biogenesis protein CcsA n=1 Tax=Micromonospora sp. NPDC049460 TaxID=3364272 RepID=UPI0037AB000C